jgi:hypothetical protein
MTVTQLAEHLGEPLHRVQYVLRSRDIEPRVRVAGCRLFGREQVQPIADELAKTAARRTTNGGDMSGLAEALLGDEQEASADAA